MGILRPPRGYWARVEAGEKLKREPLPAAGPEQDRPVVFRVDQNVWRDGRSGMRIHIQAAMHGARCEAVGVCHPLGRQRFLHEIAERHLKALEKAKPDDKGFVKVEGWNLFPVKYQPPLARGWRGRCMRSSVNWKIGIMNSRRATVDTRGCRSSGTKIGSELNWSEAKLELGTGAKSAADKRKPSWTWQLKETKPAGTLSVEISAWGLKGKRRVDGK